uniref:Uncharacterized protein n=1 Tax=Picea glauca TaxID=3330 RepID=A0A101LZ97_PICGL|nr:hypothetical protein ABT39_MTgene5083 [Picea glauca]QHR87712.1 hypothetical protein Q903MT_gene1724 [Picea sitchensis]
MEMQLCETHSTTHLITLALNDTAMICWCICHFKFLIHNIWKCKCMRCHCFYFFMCFEYCI